eukprot:6179563-Pleurochrysis_carterae.AAC.3
MRRLRRIRQRHNAQRGVLIPRRGVSCAPPPGRAMVSYRGVSTKASLLQEGPAIPSGRRKGPKTKKEFFAKSRRLLIRDWRHAHHEAMCNLAHRLAFPAVGSARRAEAAAKIHWNWMVCTTTKRWSHRSRRRRWFLRENLAGTSTLSPWRLGTPAEVDAHPRA